MDFIEKWLVEQAWTFSDEDEREAVLIVASRYHYDRDEVLGPQYAADGFVINSV